MIEGVTGHRVPPDDVEALAEAMADADLDRLDPARIVANAERFSVGRFQERLRAEVERPRPAPSAEPGKMPRMDRLRSALAVLPALLPGACVVLLAFQAGGFFPTSWAPIAAVGAIALALRVATVRAAVRRAAASGAASRPARWRRSAPGSCSRPAGRTPPAGRTWSSGGCSPTCPCSCCARRWRRASTGCPGRCGASRSAIGVVCVLALITRLRPDIYANEGSGFGRLDYPLTYWNGLGILAGIGGILGLHLTASDREPWPVRVLAAALPPIAACTVYFTLSRGGIFATAFGLVVYLLLGFSRATPGALLALLPPCAIALQRAYDADLLVKDGEFRLGRRPGRGPRHRDGDRGGGRRRGVAARDRAAGRQARRAGARARAAARGRPGGLAAAVVGGRRRGGRRRGRARVGARQVDRFLSSNPAPTGRMRAAASPCSTTTAASATGRSRSTPGGPTS